MSAAARPTNMTTQQLSELTQSQRDRLAFIELRLRFVGEFRRQDLVSRFGIQTAAATRDLGAYKDLAPRNLEYDAKSKVYRCGEWFRPVFDFSPDRVLTLRAGVMNVTAKEDEVLLIEGGAAEKRQSVSAAAASTLRTASGS